MEPTPVLRTGNSKSKIRNPKQFPNPNAQNSKHVFWPLRFWLLGIVWNLVLGAWSFQRGALVRFHGSAVNKGAWWMPWESAATKDVA